MRADDRVLILEGRKWIWSQEEIERAISLFSSGLRPSQVSREMREHPIDVGMLYLHLLDQDEIKIRGVIKC